MAYVGDPLDGVYYAAWNVHQLFQSAAKLADANFFFPNPRPWLLAPHRLLPSLLSAPIIALTGNAILGANLAVAVAYLLAAMGGRHLGSRLGLDPLAAWTAGALYAFHTYQVNEAARVQVVFHGFLPFAVAELLALWHTGRRRHGWRLGALMLLQGLADNYSALYGTLLLTLIAAALTIACPRKTIPRLLWLGPPAVVVALLMLPLVSAYFDAAHVYSFARGYPTGIDVQHYFTTSPGNLIYGHMGAPFRMQQRGPHFIGFASLALSGVAVCAWLLRRGPELPGSLLASRVWVPAAAFAALLFAALSLGKDAIAFGRDLGPGPYRLLHDYVPGFAYLRIPERLGLLSMLFVALLVGRALALLQHVGWQRLTAVMVVLVPLEHVSVLPSPTPLPVGDNVPAVYRWLAQSDARAVAEVPVHGEGLVRKETLEEYFSTFHWKPIIHGYASYQPLLSKILRRTTAEFPSEMSLQVLQRVGVDTVVVHHGRAGSGGIEAPLSAAVASGRLRLLARFAGPSARPYEGTADEVYRLVPSASHRPAPFPTGRRRLDESWRYRTKEGDPRPALDGQLLTAWTVPHSLDGDEFFEVTFAQPIVIEGLVLPLWRESAFPIPFRVAGRQADGSWRELARLDEPHVLQLVDQLLRDPGHARLGFDLGGREVWGLSLLVADGATSFEGWSLSEVEVWAR